MVRRMSKRMIAGLVLVVGIWWLRRGDNDAHVAARVQAAVLPDGFAVLVDGKQVRELDRDGTTQHQMLLRLDAEVRLVGSRAGSAVGWRDGKRVKLAVLDSDGNADEPTAFGKKATQLCDGAASNEHRFGVGWLESDGRVWFVHGPNGGAAGIELMETASTANVTWCGIASAEQNVTLIWREGAKTYMNFCGTKQCSSLVAKVPVDSKDTLLGYGCVRDACLFATRDRAGATRLHRVTEKGRAIVKPLDNAAADTSISIVGAGTRAFAIAYIATNGLATVERVAVDGTFTDVWHFGNERQAPALAWAADKLLVAFASEKFYSLAVPR
jgi:hypothetical protein